MGILLIIISFVIQREEDKWISDKEAIRDLLQSFLCLIFGCLLILISCIGYCALAMKNQTCFAILWPLTMICAASIFITSQLSGSANIAIDSFCNEHE